MAPGLIDSSEAELQADARSPAWEAFTRMLVLLPKRHRWSQPTAEGWCTWMRVPPAIGPERGTSSETVSSVYELNVRLLVVKSCALSETSSARVPMASPAGERQLIRSVDEENEAFTTARSDTSSPHPKPHR
eukprot:4460852-Prymnesium_polylepis.1